MYSLRRTFKEKLIPVVCRIDIFEKTLEPILLYGAEIKEFSNTKIIEKLYLKTLKQILGLRKSTPTYMIYCDNGKYPIIAKIKMRMIKYVIKLTKGNGNNLSEFFLKTMTKDNVDTYKWLVGIKKILRDIGSPFPDSQIHNIHPHTADIKLVVCFMSRTAKRPRGDFPEGSAYLKEEPLPISWASSSMLRSSIL